MNQFHSKKQDVATGAGSSSLEQFRLFHDPRHEMKEVFNDLISINPQYFEAPVAQIISYAEEKRWFELGSSLEELFSAEVTIGEREIIFSKFILPFAKLLNPKHLTNIIILVSKEFSSPSKSLEFIKNNSKIVENQKFAPLLQLQAITLMIQNGLFEDSLKLLTELSKDINEFSPLPIRSEYWKTKCLLDKANGNFDDFYQDAFYYLSTSSPKSYTISLAFDLCIAAIVAKNIYSFQELSAHPILDTLANTRNGWIRDLILLLNEGNPDTIYTFEHEFADKIKGNKYLASHLDLLRSKIKMSIFMTVVFNKPFDNRTVTFDEIAENCHIQKPEVEHIALKAFANNLIKGHIDQVEECITITWSKPRALTIERIKHLKGEIDRWCQIVSRIQENEASRAEGIIL